VLRVVSGGQRAAGFSPIGARELKGLPDPIPVVEILWEHQARSAVPLPPRLAQAPHLFVGRSAPLAELGHAFADVVQRGRRQLVLIAGEPGLGKTSLVSRAAAAWHDGGATIALGWSDPHTRVVYRPFIDALAPLVEHAPAEMLHAHIERHGAAIARLTPGLGGRVRSLPAAVTTDPDTERYLLFSAVSDLLADLSEEAPIVLVLDDLHWADSATVSLLRSLVADDRPARLLVVGTFRSDEVSGNHPMALALADFRRMANASRLPLDGLTIDDIRHLLEGWTGTGDVAGGRELAAQLLAETDGNAFFVTEMIRFLAHAGRLGGPASIPRSGVSSMPESILEVLGQRVAGLGRRADEVLSVAAVVGGEFDSKVLTAVLGWAEDEVVDVLTEATSAALVGEVDGMPGRFVFTHALVRHAILVNLGATREAGLHRRVAEALEGLGDLPIEALAHHWLHATTSADSTRARDWARRAGDAALEGLAPADAVTSFRQAVLLHDQLADGDVPTRIDLLTKLGVAERQAGDPEHRDTLLKACRLALRIGDSGRLATAALANNNGSFSAFQGVDAERVAMLEAAIAHDTDEHHRALLLATLANELTYSGDLVRRRQLADDAQRSARATGDQAVLLRVINTTFHACWLPDTLQERVALTEESQELVAATDDPMTKFLAASAGLHNLFQAGRTEEADQLLESALGLAQRLSQPSLLWRITHVRAARELLGGHTDRAELLARRAFEHGQQAGEPHAVAYFRTQEVCIHWQRGTMTELAARVRGSTPRPASGVAAVCLVLAESDRLDEATALLDLGASTGFREVPMDPTFVATLAMLAEAAILTEHTDAAEPLVDLMGPFAAQVGFDGVTSVGNLEHYVGALQRVLGRPDPSISALTRAVDRHRAMGASFFEARSRFELARSQLVRGRVGDAEAAAGELRGVIASAGANQHDGVCRRARHLLGSMEGA
jgi:hypothetical protein